jgi:hypothetical protein
MGDHGVVVSGKIGGHQIAGGEPVISLAKKVLSLLTGGVVK